MNAVISDGAERGLERSCGPGPRDWFRIAGAVPGLERGEGRFAAHAYDPHRHDSYALGYTLRGVQVFRYRGEARRSASGHVFVLHPDEVHDGHAGTDEGFGYRILYLEPRLVQEAAGGPYRPLPFVRDVVSTDRRLAAAIGAALDDLDMPLEALRLGDIVLDIADAMAAVAGTPRRAGAPRHGRAVARAREFLDAHLQAAVSTQDLETVSGMSRFALARQFRRCLGTSPYRYHLMRRLQQARARIRDGRSLADAAVASGFADQSHFTRHFRNTFGMTPGRWAALARAHR